MKQKMKSIISTILVFSTLILVMPINVLAADGSTTVYVTKTGEKYHTSGCQYLRKSKISISLQDAVSSGYEPCSRCNPLSLTVKQNTATEPVSLETDSAVQKQETGSQVYTGAYAAYPAEYDRRVLEGLIDDDILEECYEISDYDYFTINDKTVYNAFTSEQDQVDFAYYILIRNYDNMFYALQHPEIFYTEDFNVDEYYEEHPELAQTIGYDVNALYQSYLSAK